ncbi:ABC transporter substrate-binding protein [Mycolicibacterium sp. F2034L]|uniref:ABC transporter substrate-binding protein n=1 Tax=Mycolicibacterium sp. F2034L TaxID=2926422 RepID=UPI001FF4398C|nr:ABC transporter substrate-binding protein [Mycolicibacterium sp. F2034L]MCK0175948.1 ABC transporter substrate-binding protein [Mycolicibacterium sp. F2034L]
MEPMHVKPYAVALLTPLILMVLTACGGSGAAETPPPEASAVTVDNCGVEVTVDRPPTRAVGYFQQSVELMLALGLQDAIVASVYPDNPPLPRFAEAYRAIPVLSAKDASFEQILALAPDFVYGGYSSAFDQALGRSRQAFTDAGITSYLNPEYCATSPITMDDVYREVHTIAGFFGVDDRADDLVRDMQSSVSAAHDKVAGVSPQKVFVYDSGEATAFTAGGQGIGDEIIELAGGVNVFSDVAETFADVSWEQVLAADPDVIVIYDYFGTPPVQEKKQYLRSKPELAGVPAIRDDRFAVLTLQDAVLGVRAPYAVDTLARQLHPDRFR